MLSCTPLLVVGLALAGTACAQDESSIGVLFEFEAQPAPSFVKALQREVAGVMAQASFHLQWITENREGQSWGHAFIVKFRGTCSAAARTAEWTPGDRATLGKTVDQEGAILPYAEFDCDRVRSFLHTNADSSTGRATGRLLAHELYHLLLQTREHSKKGIAKAVQTPAALLSRSLLFQSEDLERLRSLH